MGVSTTRYLVIMEDVEDTGNNVDVDDGHTDGHVDNVDDGHTDGHIDTCTWSDVLRRSTIGGRNVQP